MVRFRWMMLLVAVAAYSGWAAGPLLAQSAPVAVPLPPSPSPSPTPAPGSAAERIARMKQPLKWLSWGADLRTRDEYLDNAVSLSDEDPLHEQNVIRVRPRLWSAITPISDVALNTRLVGEVRYWTRPAFVGAFREDEGTEWRYGIVDNFNAKWSNIGGQPLAVTAGRQDILLGDHYNWWLTGDGTPNDGSFTYFLDAVRTAYEAKDIHTKFEVIGISQDAEIDARLPTINAHQDEYNLTEQDETGGIFYVSNSTFSDLRTDAYFIYKGDDQYLANGDNADIYTVGNKLLGKPFDCVQWSLEGAYQFGRKEDPTLTVPAVSEESRDISAYGVNGQLNYLFKDPYNNQAHLVFELLSGDDPDSEGTDEMFDVLWGRWPRWSELYLYSYINETSRRVGQWNNLGRTGAGWTIQPSEAMHFGLYYNALFAPEEVATRAANPALFSGDGNFRGHFLQAVLTHTFSKHMKGHLWLELLWEGDYYAQRDTLVFVRPELYFTF